jgi:predicted double-glycine peptidase
MSARVGLVRFLSVAAALSASGGAHAMEIAGFAGGPWSVQVRSIKEARIATTIRQRYDFSCGAAAVATLLTYHYGDRINEQEVFQGMFERGDQALIRREGFSLLDMKLFLEGRGYRADGIEASLDELARARIPAIVLVRENGYAHFVVIKGIRDGRVLVGDPAVGSKTYPQTDFEKIWLNRILFLIRDKQDVAHAHFNVRSEWAAHPTMAPGLVLSRDSLAGITVLRPGPSDF